VTTLRALAARVRAGETASRVLVERSLQRIADLNPDLGAVVGLRAGEALEEAAGLDDHGPAGPLAGLPVLIKDLTDVAGMRTTFGSLLFADAPPAERDGLVTARLRAAGAIVVGKTNMPEFAAEGYTSNRVFGTTRNPWNRLRTTGGSSGGSSAAIAAGMAAIATATDTGGSIRIPAAYGGLVGLKPTNGVIAREAATHERLEWIDFTTDGPIGVHVDDVRLQMEVLAGPAPGDQAALPEPLGLSSMTGRRPSRVLLARRWSDRGPLPAEIEALFVDAAARFAAMFGLEPEPYDAPAALGAVGDPDDDWFTITGAELAQALGGADGIARVRDLLAPSTVGLVGEGSVVDIASYIAARRRRFGYARVLDEALGADVVLVSPVMTVDAIAAEGPGGDEGTGSEMYVVQAQNLTGHPAISLPAGTHASGVPFGLQVTAPRFADGFLLDLADAWEAAHPWPESAPGYLPFA